MKSYTYRSYKTRDVVVELLANDILEADAMYGLLGYGNPAKQPYIGCYITEDRLIAEC